VDRVSPNFNPFVFHVVINWRNVHQDDIMRDLLVNRRCCERSIQKTSWRHFSSVDMEKIVNIFLQDLSKRKHTGVLQIFHSRNTDEISRTSRVMHDGNSFDKIQRKQAGYFGTRINWKQP
jgi:hypothetical protein